jgi:hypothetical protein
LEKFFEERFDIWKILYYSSWEGSIK